MAEPAPPTILAHKTAFLTAQTLQLSQPLAPSHAWQQRNNSNPESSSTARGTAPLSQKNLEDALFRLNHLLQQHSRRVYAPQASRHVAEQVERLLIDSADRYIAGRREDEEGDREGDERGDDDALRIGADLTTDRIISTLPQTWSAAHPKQAEQHPPEAKRYEDLASSLASLSARRDQARQRAERLRKMKGLLQPFDGGATQDESGGSNVQQNLVTRNGDVEKELERMRMLLVRVSGRLAQLPPPGARRQGEDVTMDDGDGGDEAVEDLDVVERNKVDALLNGF